MRYADNDKHGQADTEETLIGEGQRLYQAAVQQYEAVVHKAPHQEEEALLAHVKTSGEALLQKSGELLALKKRGTNGTPILEKKEEFEQAEMTFLQAVETAIANEDGQFVASKTTLETVLNHANTNVLSISLLTFLVSLLAGATIARIIARPIATLTETATAMSNGQLDVTVEIPGPRGGRLLSRLAQDEVTHLATAFALMLRHLHEYHVQVESHQ